MRIVHNPFVLQSQQNAIIQSTNPFEEISTTTQLNDNSTIAATRHPTITTTNTQNYLGGSPNNNGGGINPTLIDGNNLSPNGNTITTTTTNTTTEDIVEKLSSIYGHIDNSNSLHSTAVVTENQTARAINLNNILHHTNETIGSNGATNINTFTNNFNQSYSDSNAFNLNSYFNHPATTITPTNSEASTPINYDSGHGSSDESTSNSTLNTHSSGANRSIDKIDIDDDDLDDVDDLDEEYKNSLRNAENNQKTILNNLNQQQFGGTSGIGGTLKHSNSNNINLRHNNNTSDLFFENLNVLCAKQDIKSPSSIEDFNIKTISGFSKLKSLEYYSDSSSQSSSEEEAEEEDDEDEEDDDSDENIDNELEEKHHPQTRKHCIAKPENKKDNVNNDATIDVDDDNEDGDEHFESKVEAKKSPTNENRKSLSNHNQFSRNSTKLTNRLTETDLHRHTNTHTIQIEPGFVVAASSGEPLSPRVYKKPVYSPFQFNHKMAGDNEKNAGNAEENEIYSESESVEMKSLQDEAADIAVEADAIEQMDIDKASECCDDNEVKIDCVTGNTDDTADVVDAHQVLQNILHDANTKRRSSSPAANNDASDNTISEKSFAGEVKANNAHTSPTLSFASANSSSHGSAEYPRGIINPNYPGFQHLAHTLSEHFVNHPNDPDDSDLSEFEVELSIDDDIAFTNEDINDHQKSFERSSSPAEELVIPALSAVAAAGTPVTPAAPATTPTVARNTNSPKMMASHDDYHHNLLDGGSAKPKDFREHKEILLPEIRISFECHDLKLEDRFDLKDSPKRLAIATSQEKVPKVQRIEKLKSTPSHDKAKPAAGNRVANEQPSHLTRMSEPAIEDISCDLDTYLQKYETATDIKLKTLKRIEDLKQELKREEEKEKMEKFKAIQTKQIDSEELDDESRNCPTPDILIKNCKNDFRRKAGGNRPDLLRNVSPQPSCDETTNVAQSLEDEKMSEEGKIEIEFNADDHEGVTPFLTDDQSDVETTPVKTGRAELKIARINVPDNIPIEGRRTDHKDDTSFGTTPVDIVGDFGREVEREFGLLVSGYNSRILCRDPSPINMKSIEGNESPSPTKIERHEKNFMHKMTDAHLSDAKENINFGAATAATAAFNSLGAKQTSTSLVANIVVARATLNHPATDLCAVTQAASVTPSRKQHTNIDSVAMQCDLLMQTNKFVGVKTPSPLSSSSSSLSSIDGDTKVKFIPKQKQSPQKQVVEEKLLPSLLVSSDRPLKKIPPPPPPRRFLQQQLQQMHKRQQELQQQQQQLLQQQQEQQKQLEQQRQLNKHKYVNNPFVSALDELDLNATSQTSTSTTATTQAQMQSTGGVEKLSANTIKSSEISKTETVLPDTPTAIAHTVTTQNSISDSLGSGNTDSTDTLIKTEPNALSTSSSSNDITKQTRQTATSDTKSATTSACVDITAEEEKQKQQQQQQQHSEATTAGKPKYQKFSFDDRQLPPVGIGVFEQNSRPWYEQQHYTKSEKNPNTTNSCSSTGSTLTTHSGAGESRKTRKNHLNANLSASHKSNQIASADVANSGNGNTPAHKKSTVKKYTRSAAKDHHSQYNCGSNCNSSDEGHQSPINHNRHSKLSSSSLSSSSSTSSRYHYRNNGGSSTKQNTTATPTAGSAVTNNGCIGSATTAAISRKKDTKTVIPNDDEFIRHDIYKSLTRSYEKQYQQYSNNNNSSSINNNQLNSIHHHIKSSNGGNSRTNDMNNRSGGGGLLIDNSYRYGAVRSSGDSTTTPSKYYLNLQNPNNCNNNINLINKYNMNSSGSGRGGGSAARKNPLSNSANFDVYNIETALPSIDLDAIESHLQKAKEEEKKRRNDREEIRRRLAMGAEDDYFTRMTNNSGSDRPGRKPSLQSRLQNGNNLQICFMNDASSDTESISSDSETCPKLSTKSTATSNASSRYSSMSSIAASNPYSSRPLSVNITSNNNSLAGSTTTLNSNGNSRRTLSQRPSTLSLGPPISEESTAESDFFTKQARLQIEARMALAQAKDMAHMQMEIERQKQKESPITEVIRNSMEKVGVNFPVDKRRVSRQMCTDMNIAQLQIIVNDLHSQIERLNDQLVQFLMERDELHMSQDSMLVDIEDLTRYLSAKEQTLLNEITDRTSQLDSKQYQQLQKAPTHNNNNNNNNNTTTNGTKASNHDATQQMQSKFQRIANLVKK